MIDFDANGDVAGIELLYASTWGTKSMELLSDRAAE
jgi:uncharacterized protein YuzE